MINVSSQTNRCIRQLRDFGKGKAKKTKGNRCRNLERQAETRITRSHQIIAGAKIFAHGSRQTSHSKRFLKNGHAQNVDAAHEKILLREHLTVLTTENSCQE